MFTHTIDRATVYIYIIILLKGNLAHNFMDFYFLCLSFHLDISNMLKTKYIGNTGLPASHRGEKIQFGNPFKFAFPYHSPCDVITLGNSLLTKREFLSLCLDVFEV